MHGTNCNDMSLGADRCLYRRSRLITCEYACEDNGCMEALSSMQRDAEVAPKCLLRSLVMRKKRDSLERALEAKEKGRGKKGK